MGVAGAMVLGAYAPMAQAQTTPHCVSVASIDPTVSELQTEAGSARTWRYVWTGINGGLTVIPLAGIAVLPKSDRPSLIVGASTSFLAAGVTWFWPLNVESDAQKASAAACRAASNQDEQLNRLREHSRRDEQARIQWPWHLVNLGLAMIPGAILWAGFHDLPGGALTSAGAFATGELQLLTQPTGLLSPPGATASASTPWIGSITPIHSGVMLRATLDW
jgi:hypothetical protein